MRSTFKDGAHAPRCLARRLLGVALLEAALLEVVLFERHRRRARPA